MGTVAKPAKLNTTTSLHAGKEANPIPSSTSFSDSAELSIDRNRVQPNDGTYHHHPDYDPLPYVIRSQISPKEFAWLPEHEKRDIIRDMTTPEPFDD